MNLNFKIHQNYLLTHIIQTDKFFKDHYEKDLTDLRNKAWEISKPHYNLLLGQLWNPSDHADEIYRTLLCFVERVKLTKEFQRVLRQTQDYLEFTRKDWEENYEFCESVLANLTGFDFENKEFTVYLTHPGLKNGKYLGENTLTFSHHEDWPHYSIIYFWHEILHAYFGKTDLEHALIELLTDEELRVRLNNGSYPPFVGHRDLETLKTRILPYWKQYLAQEKPRDIMQFKEQLIRRHLTL